VPKKDTLITKTDRDRLRSFLKAANRAGDEPAGELSELRKRVRSARTVHSKRIPRNVITMNSVVVLKDLGSGHLFTIRLAYPSQARKFGRLSVARPVGRALLGKSVGDIVPWPAGRKRRQLRIQRITYQPEAAGDFHL
jgi:regulator of nucleoside diphosphate kinase